MLKRIFVQKRWEVIGVWRKLRNDELQNCTFRQILSGDKFNDIEMGRVCCANGRYKRYIQNFTRKTCRDKITWKT